VRLKEVVAVNQLQVAVRVVRLALVGKNPPTSRARRSLAR
jgi:hypothetical protein